MNTIQFDSVVVVGLLEIPEQFRDQLTGKVHVVVSRQDEVEIEDGLSKLLKNPLHVPGFEPLTRDEANER